MPVKKLTKKNRSKRRNTNKRSNSKRRNTHKRRNTNKRSHSKRRHVMRGGQAPATFIGSPYNAGDRIPNGNFLPLSQPYGITAGFPIPPVNSNPQFLKGGGKKGRKTKQRGGGISSFISSILPDDVVNLGRYVTSSAGNLMDKYNGLIPTASSQVYPTQQPLAQTQGQSTVKINQVGQTQVIPVDVNAAYNRAVSSVRAI